VDIYPNVDADVTFGLRLDNWEQASALGTNFWSDDGWRHDRSDIVNKLTYQQRQGTYPAVIHPEIVMFARADGPDTCASSSQPVLPGWAQGGSDAVLINGRPALDVMSGEVSSFLRGSVQVDVGTRVRVTGALVLDCGHAEGQWTPPFVDTRPCHQNDVDCDHCQNVEIHPVYSIDVVQNWLLARSGATLSGTWAGPDAGTYYVRQIKDRIWWLGLSVDQGRAFANVFSGYVQPGGVVGSWADVPIWARASQNSGEITLQGAFCTRQPGSANSTCDQNAALNKANWMTTSQTSNGVFQRFQWQKLYDVSPAVLPPP
jgi:hypothetical protein